MGTAWLQLPLPQIEITQNNKKKKNFRQDDINGFTWFTLQPQKSTDDYYTENLKNKIENLKNQEDYTLCFKLGEWIIEHVVIVMRIHMKLVQC
jgi:hypothetical protein